MEKVTKEVIFSLAFFDDLKSVYQYGLETFGEFVADIFHKQIIETTTQLPLNYLHYPECKYLETKLQIYRNIMLGKYLVIYRIKPNRIEVLRIIHSSRKPSKRKMIKRLKI